MIKKEAAPMQDLLKLLQSRQESFSPAQKAVAEYILRHYADIPFRSISQIAELTGTSEPTVSKFCNELGFSGFSGLKHRISEHVSQGLHLNDRLQRSAMQLGAEDALRQTMDRDTENIRLTLETPANREAMDALLPMLDRARQIYTIGTRTSAFFSGLLAFKLRQQGLRVHAIDLGVNDYMDKLMLIGPEDLVIALSFPRFAQPTVKMLRVLKQRSVPIVLITGDGLTPAFDCADLTFSCVMDSTSYVASYSACLSLINAILLTRALEHKDQVEENLRELEGYFEEFGMFVD